MKKKHSFSTPDEKKSSHSSHFERSFKLGLVLKLMIVFDVVVAFVLIVQQLVELFEQHQQMNIQEDLVEIELEQDVLIRFRVEDNHKHGFELVPIV
jgi:hypothetical protein